MLAGGAELGSLLGLDDETAVAALPPDRAVALEEITVREAAQQLQVAALVLGLVLGQMCESNFRRAYTLTNGSLTQIFTKPITAVIMICCIVMLVYPFIKPLFIKNKAEGK